MVSHNPYQALQGIAVSKLKVSISFALYFELLIFPMICA